MPLINNTYVLIKITTTQPVYCFRCYVSVAEMDGMIYAMGGFDGHVRQSTAERYQPKKNQWSLVSPMRHQRSDASATSLEGEYIACRVYINV